MIAHLKKWWLSYGTVITGAVVMGIEASHSYLQTHPKASLEQLGVAVVWAVILHRVKSPNQ